MHDRHLQALFLTFHLQKLFVKATWLGLVKNPKTNPSVENIWLRSHAAYISSVQGLTQKRSMLKNTFSESLNQADLPLCHELGVTPHPVFSDK